MGDVVHKRRTDTGWIIEREHDRTESVRDEEVVKKVKKIKKIKEGDD